MTTIAIVALILLIISVVISAVNKALSSTDFALWAIGVILILPHLVKG